MSPISFLRIYLKIDELQTQKPWIHVAAVTVPTLMLATGVSLLLAALFGLMSPNFQWQRGDDVRLMSVWMRHPFMFLIVGPILQELIFRVALVRYFSLRFSWLASVGISAGLYGVWTLDPIGGALFALAMTAIYLRTGTLLAAIITHALVNLLDLIVVGLMKMDPAAPMWTGSVLHNPMVLGVFILMCLVGVPGVYWSIQEIRQYAVKLHSKALQATNAIQ